MKQSFWILMVLILAVLASACSGAPTPAAAPTVDAAGIHTAVAGTLYAAVPSATDTPTPPVPTRAATGTPEPLPTAEVKMIATLENVPRLSGYGLPGTRVLAQPVGVTREGITVAVEQVIVYADRIELVYTVRDIPHAALFDPMADDLALTCEGPAKYPNLMLPDGTVIFPENYLLDGKAFGMFEEYAGSYLVHIYRAAVPAQVSEMTLTLDCLELPRIDRAPQNWEVPFRVVPAGSGG